MTTLFFLKGESRIHDIDEVTLLKDRHIDR